MRLPAFPALLLLAAVARAEGGAVPPPKAPPPMAGDLQEKEFTFRMGRARELAARAVSGADASLAREAYGLFLGAAHVRPGDPVPLAEAGLLALQFGDQASSEEMVRALAALAPDSGACRFLRGCLLQAREDYAGARAEFAAAKTGEFRAPQADHRFFQCTVGLGLQYTVANLLDEALKTLSEAVAMRPDDPLVPVAYGNMGVAHRRLQAPREAEKILRLSIERFPAYAPSYGELGEMLAELDRIDEALEVLDRSVKADPTYFRGWLLMASVQASRGRFREAEEAFREHDRRFRPTGLSEFHRGLFLQKKGEPARAIECLQRSIALDSAMVSAVYWISLCHRDLGDEKKAAEYMERWKKVEEENKRQFAEEIERARRKVGPPPPPAPAPAPPPAGEDRDLGTEGKAKDAGGR